MPTLSSYDQWKTDPDPHGRQEAFEAAQQDAEDESLMDAINDFDPNEENTPCPATTSTRVRTAPSVTRLGAARATTATPSGATAPKKKRSKPPSATARRRSVTATSAPVAGKTLSAENPVSELSRLEALRAGVK